MILKHISKISNSEATALGLKINEVISSINFTEEEKQSVSIFYKPFNKALYELINARQLSKHLCNGETKGDLHHIREDKFRGIKYQLKAYLLLGNVKEIEIARNMLAIIQNNTNGIEKRSHDEKTGSLAAIIEELDDLSDEELEFINIKRWIDDFKEAQFNFINYSIKFSASRSANHNKYALLKTNYFDLLHEFINFVPYQQKITPTENLAIFNQRINELIGELEIKARAKYYRKKEKNQNTLSTDLPEAIVEADELEEPAKLIPSQSITDTIDN